MRMNAMKMKDAAGTLHNSTAFLIAAENPDGSPGFAYNGNRNQLTTLFRFIRDELRLREGIGNHPNRRDIVSSRKPDL